MVAGHSLPVPSSLPISMGRRRWQMLRQRLSSSSTPDPARTQVPGVMQLPGGEGLARPTVCRHPPRPPTASTIPLPRGQAIPTASVSPGVNSSGGVPPYSPVAPCSSTLLRTGGPEVLKLTSQSPPDPPAMPMGLTSGPVLPPSPSNPPGPPGQETRTGPAVAPTAQTRLGGAWGAPQGASTCTQLPALQLSPTRRGGCSGV
ncbi:uncharacterized protein ACIBXB_018445 [Morphnus guianensis]